MTVLDRMPVSEDERIKIVPTNPDDLVVNGLSMSAGESADSDDKKEWGRPRPSSNEEMRLDGLSVLTQDAQPSSAWNIYVSFLVAAKPWMLRCRTTRSTPTLDYSQIVDDEEDLSECYYS